MAKVAKGVGAMAEAAMAVGAKVGADMGERELVKGVTATAALLVRPRERRVVRKAVTGASGGGGGAAAVVMAVAVRAAAETAGEAVAVAVTAAVKAAVTTDWMVGRAEEPLAAAAAA